MFPAFTEAEKDIILDGIQAYLRLLGDGDLQTGIAMFWLRGAHPNVLGESLYVVPEPVGPFLLPNTGSHICGPPD